MTTQNKTVFGYFQGNITAKCELIGEFKEGKLWLIVSKHDRNLALEKNDILYRITHEDYKENVITSLNKGNLLKIITDSCDFLIKHHNPEKSCNHNVNYFALCDRLDQSIMLLENNERLREQEKKRKQDERDEKEKQERAEKEKILDTAEIKVSKGEKISCNVLVSLCDRHNIKIALRTRGWLLNNGEYISAETYTYKEGNGSKNAFKVYFELKDLLTKEK